jgi:hypothetical protein
MTLGINQRHPIFYRLIHPRKTHIFGVGTGKSGTHTLAEIWGEQFRTAHEPESEYQLGLFLQWNSGQLTDKALIRHLVALDKKLWLEINSSAVNFLFLDFLKETFRHSKFILTIRDPYHWLDSIINHQLTHPCSVNWQKMREIRFRPDLYTHPNEEAILKERHLYTLDGYLSYWSYHNKRVLETIPANRLLVVRTDQINQKIDELACFTGIKAIHSMKPTTHSFPAKAKLGILSKIDQDYLNSRINRHCGDMLQRYFPDIAGIGNY